MKTIVEGSNAESAAGMSRSAVRPAGRGGEGLLRRAARAIAENPLPLALISAGIAWYALSRRSAAVRPVNRVDPYDYSPYQGRRRRLTAASAYQDDPGDPAYRVPYTRDDFYATNADTGRSPAL